MDDKDRTKKADTIESIAKDIREDRAILSEITGLRAKMFANKSGTYYMINERLQLPYKYYLKGLDTAIAEYRKDLTDSIDTKINKLKNI